MANISNYSKYEIARVLGARALQIAMNAPLLIKIPQEDLEGMNFDALKIAEKELNSGVLPITVNKPFPSKEREELEEEFDEEDDKEETSPKEESEEEIIEEGKEVMEGFGSEEE